MKQMKVEGNKISTVRDEFSFSGESLIPNNVSSFYRNISFFEKAFCIIANISAEQLCNLNFNTPYFTNKISKIKTEFSLVLQISYFSNASLKSPQENLERLSIVSKAFESYSSKIRNDVDIVIRKYKINIDKKNEEIFIYKNRIDYLESNISDLEKSTSWRMTSFVRYFANKNPSRFRIFARRIVKALWWAATPHRMSARLHARIEAKKNKNTIIDQAVDDAAAISVNPRISLSNILPLHGNYIDAITWYDPLEPVVSIIILNWNSSKMTLLCLQHIWQNTRGYNYEIIIVDNGSNDDDLEFLKRNIVLEKLISVQTNRYFGEANNIGVEASRGEYICFLNNDAFVHDGWLEPLVGVLASNPATGAVGPRFLYPSGVLQEAGSLVNPDGFPIQIGKGKDTRSALYANLRKVDYVSAACMILRRKDFLAVLGFDLIWDPAYYEDVDLCLKLRLIGLATLYCPHSAVTHIENATSSDASRGLKLSNIVAINREKFVARWGDFLRSPDLGKPALVPSDIKPVSPRLGMPRIAIFAPESLLIGGDERYILTIAEIFYGIAEVTLITPVAVSRTRILTIGRELNLRLDQVSLSSLGDIYKLRLFDLAFFIENKTYSYINTISLRNILIFQHSFRDRDQEYYRMLCDKYDILIGNSFPGLSRSEKIIEIPCPPVRMMVLNLQKKIQILHVGRFFAGDKCKRQDVLIEALRKLTESGAQIELHLAGTVYPEAEHRAYYAEQVVSAHGLPVYFHPNCSDEALHKLYAESRVYWHAVGFGSDADNNTEKTPHFGMSVAEAMSAGCIPIVFAVGGAAEMVHDRVDGFHFSTVDELCFLTKYLCEEAEDIELTALAEAASEFSKVYDEIHFRSRILKIAQKFIEI